MVMVAVSVICAATNDEAAWLSGSTKLSILQRRSGQMGLLPSPQEAEDYGFNPQEMAVIDAAMASHVIGDPSVVAQGLEDLAQRTHADELMLSTRTHSYDARERSFALVADAWGLART